MGALVFGAACSAAIDDAATPAAPTSAPATVAVAGEPVVLDVGGSSPVLVEGLTSFGAAAHGGALYVLGGYVGEPHAYSRVGQRGALLRLDLASNTWQRLGEIDPAQSLALVAHEHGLVRVGGMQARNEEGTPADLHSLDTVARFDPATASWQALPSLPEPRSSHDAAVVGSVLYAVGGWTLETKPGVEEEPVWHDTVASLDLARPEAGWTELPAPFQRRGLAAAAIDGRLAVLGGLEPSRELSTRLDVLDPATGEWTRGPDYPGTGFGVSAIAAGHALYANGADGVVYRWRLGEAAWQRVGTVAYPRFFHRLVAADASSLLAVGGIRSMATGDRIRPIERIDVAAPGQPTVLAYELASPLPSKNRQGLAVIGDSLLVFGGNKSLGQHDFGPEFFADEAAALDLATLTWRPIAPYPRKRQTMSSLVTPWGHVLAVGGFGHDGSIARTHPEAFTYHPGTDTWREVGGLPGGGRSQFGLAAHEQALYVFGGLDYDPSRPKEDHFRHETSVLTTALRPDLEPFVVLPSELPAQRRAFAGTVLGDRYVVVGGMRDGFELVTDCQAFVFATKRWQPFTCPTKGRLSGELVAQGGKLYLAAGLSRPAEGTELEANRSLEVYDPATDAWSVLIDPLPIEPKHLRGLVYGDRLLFFSTHNDDGKAQLLLVDPGTTPQPVTDKAPTVATHAGG